jgi:hypothetical protein
MSKNAVSDEKSFDLTIRQKILSGFGWGFLWAAILSGALFVLLPIISPLMFLAIGIITLLCVGVGIFLNLGAVRQPCPSCGTVFTVMPTGSRCPNCGHRTNTSELKTAAKQ